MIDTFQSELDFDFLINKKVCYTFQITSNKVRGIRIIIACTRMLAAILAPKLYIPSTLNTDYLLCVADTIDCVCSKILNHGFNHGLFKFHT